MEEVLSLHVVLIKGFATGVAALFLCIMVSKIKTQKENGVQKKFSKPSRKARTWKKSSRSAFKRLPRE